MADLRWKNPAGRNPDQLYRWGQDTVTELRKGKLPSTQGLLGFCDTRSALAAAVIDASVTRVMTFGYSTVGDLGAALYKRVASQPSHPGKVQSADGTWWEIAEPVLNQYMFGAVSDNFTDAQAAFNNAFTTRYTQGVSFRGLKGKFAIYGPITFLPRANGDLSLILPGTTVYFDKDCYIRAANSNASPMLTLGSTAGDFSGVMREGYMFGGTFDCNFAANVGVVVSLHQNMILDSVRVMNAMTRYIQFGQNGTPIASYGGIARNCTTYHEIFAKNNTITNITQANPAVVTTGTAHGYSNGDIIWIDSVVGMTQVNNLYFTVAGATSTTFQLQGINSTAYGAYTSGGRTFKTVPAGLVGVYYENATDGETHNNIISGTRTGVTGLTSGLKPYNMKCQDHVFNLSQSGEVLYAYDLAGDNTIYATQVDAPIQFPFHFADKRNLLTGCGVFLGDLTTGAKDNYTIPVLLDTGAGAIVVDCDWDATSVTARLAAAVSGDISNYVVRGLTFQNMVIAPNVLTGSNTNDNAVAGDIGEVISSTIAFGSAVALTNNTPANLTSISLTPGDWDVFFDAYFLPAGTTSITTLISSISQTSATLLTLASTFSRLTTAAQVPGNAEITVKAGPNRISLAATTTIYAVAYALFTVSTMSVYGIISARRRR